MNQEDIIEKVLSKYKEIRENNASYNDLIKYEFTKECTLLCEKGLSNQEFINFIKICISIDNGNFNKDEKTRLRQFFIIFWEKIFAPIVNNCINIDNITFTRPETNNEVDKSITWRKFLKDQKALSTAVNLKLNEINFFSQNINNFEKISIPLPYLHQLRYIKDWLPEKIQQVIDRYLSKFEEIDKLKNKYDEKNLFLPDQQTLNDLLNTYDYSLILQSRYTIPINLSTSLAPVHVPININNKKINLKNKDIFLSRIQERMNELNINKTQLQKSSGLSRKALYNLSNAKTSSISQKNLKSLAISLVCSSSYLLGETNEINLSNKNGKEYITPFYQIPTSKNILKNMAIKNDYFSPLINCIEKIDARSPLSPTDINAIVILLKNYIGNKTKDKMKSNSIFYNICNFLYNNGNDLNDNELNNLNALIKTLERNIKKRTQNQLKKS